MNVNDEMIFDIDNKILKNEYFRLKVSQLNAQIKSFLDNQFSKLEIEGEISALTHHSSGHIYLTLKDEKSAISCTFFKSSATHCKIDLKIGMKIIASGAISVYEPKGVYNFNIKSIKLHGIGALKEEFEALKKELQQKGYFENKKPIPAFPKKIALLTSKTGAALQDMIKISHSKVALASFVILDTLMQGEMAKYSIAKNLKIADEFGFDVIVLARGGGSLEDLWSFNERMVAEAIYECKTPVISAIGHETDYMLSDFVSDMRAPTPSAAIAMLLMDKEEMIMKLLGFENELNEKVKYIFHIKESNIKNLANTINLLSPINKINSSISRIKDLEILLETIKNAKIASFSNDINSLQTALNLQAHNLLKLKDNNLAQISNITPLFLKIIDEKKSKISMLEMLIKDLNPKSNIKNGMVQITKNGKIVNLDEIKTNDEITITNGEISKNARIL